jgi:hypothetical protein
MQVPSGLDYLYRVLYYISRYAKGVSRQDVYVALQTEREEGEEPYMTIAEEFIQEGFERGIVKGLERGLQKGRQEERRKMVLRLAQKHSLVTVSELLGLPIEEVVALAKEPEVGDDEETADDTPPLAE